MTASNTVLSLIPATRTFAGLLKTTVADAALALDGGSLTLALRDNGPKVNGTLVFVEGKVGAPGAVFSAKNARNGASYGAHVVLGTVEYKVEDGAVSLGTVDSLIDVGLDTKAAVFQIA